MRSPEVEPRSKASRQRAFEALDAEGRARAADALRGELEGAKQARIERLLGRAAIPERFADYALDSYDANAGGKAAERALAVCRHYAEHFPEMRRSGICLTLIGGPGTGKTHLACGVLHAITAQGYTGLFVTVADALRLVRATYHAASPRTEQDVIDALAAPSLLVLDEVGVTHGRDDTRKAMLFDILDARYRAVKPTICIGNLTTTELADYLGERLIDRLAEAGGLTVSFTWSSYRTGGKQP